MYVHTFNVQAVPEFTYIQVNHQPPSLDIMVARTVVPTVAACSVRKPSFGRSTTVYFSSIRLFSKTRMYACIQVEDKTMMWCDACMYACMQAGRHKQQASTIRQFGACQMEDTQVRVQPIISMQAAMYSTLQSSEWCWHERQSIVVATSHKPHYHELV